MTEAKFHINNKSLFKSTYKVDELEFDSLLNFINAPPSLHQFESVLNNLIRLFRVDLNQSIRIDLDFSEQKQKAWLVLVKSIKIQLSQNIPVSLKNLEIRPTGLTKGLVEYSPLYAALAINNKTYPDNEIDKINYLQLVCLCAAHRYDCLERSGVINKKNSSFITSLRDFRKIGLQKIGNIILPDLRNEESLEDVLYLFESWIENNRPKLSNLGDGIRLLFESVLQEKDRQKKSFRNSLKSQTKINNKPFFIYDYKDDPTDQESGPKVDLIKYTSDPKVQNKLIEKGLHPEEFDKTASLLITDTLAPDSIQFDEILIRHRNARNARSALIKNVQQLQNSWPNPTPYETAILLKVAHNIQLLKKDADRFTINEKKDLSNLILLMVYTGRDLDDILKTKIIKNKSSYYKLKIDTLAFLVEEQVLAIPVTSPAKSHKFKTAVVKKVLSDEPFYHNNINLSDVIFVRLHKRTTELIASCAKLIPTDEKYTKINLFENQNVIESNLNSLLIYINKRFVTRWTIKRLGYVMKKAINKCTKDQSLIYLITGDQTGHSVVSSYYLRISNTNIQYVMEKAYEYIKTWVQFGIDKQVRVDFDLKEAYKQKTVGSALALSDNYVKELCQHFKQKIKVAYKTKQGEDRVISTHNALVAYITTWLGFITGYRAVLSPISHPSEVNLKNCLLIISDKDNDLYQHTRVIPLTSKFIEQIHTYIQHLKQLAPRLNKNKSLQDDLYKLIHTACETSNDSVLNIPFLFFLNPALQVKPVSPENLKEYYPSPNPFPINANRHYLRSRLLAAGADSECISYFLGHWADGEEPYQKHSTISLAEIADEIGPYIEILESNAIWTVQKGLANV